MLRRSRRWRPGPERRPADHHGSGAEREGLDHVAAAANAAVQEDLDVAADRLDDSRQGTDGRGRPVEVVAIVIGDRGARPAAAAWRESPGWVTFVLIALQLRAVVDGLSRCSASTLGGCTLAVAGVLVATRLVWFFTVPYRIRAIDRRPAEPPGAWARGGASSSPGAGCAEPSRELVGPVVAETAVTPCNSRGSQRSNSGLHDVPSWSSRFEPSRT